MAKKSKPEVAVQKPADVEASRPQACEMKTEESATLTPGAKLDFSQILTKTIDVESKVDDLVPESSSKKRGRTKKKVVTIVAGEAKLNKGPKLRDQATTKVSEELPKVAPPPPSLPETSTAADSSSSDFEPMQKTTKRQLEEAEPGLRRSSQRIKKNMDDIVKRKEQQRLIEQEIDELEERAKKRRKVTPSTDKPLVAEADADVNDDEIQVEKVVITPQKKSDKKLAPIFVMGKKANPIKVIEDPAKAAARLAFLHSSVPQTLRNQIASNKVSNIDCDATHTIFVRSHCSKT